MKWALVFLALMSLLSICQSQSNFPFRDFSLPWDVRVEDLISRLTSEEMIMQVSHGGASKLGTPTPPIERLGIGPYIWNTECLSGDVDAGPATSFPMSIGLAASFSVDLVYAVAAASGIEVRAKNNDDVAKHKFGTHQGLSCFSPVVNIMRHPTWGRNQETYGEDPYLSGQLAAAFVKGLQGQHPRYVRANAGCKHFDVHAGPENIPVSRMSFDAKVSERDWRQTFLPQFQECVRAGTFSLMCSYNRVNGVPACANRKLMQTILRDEWGFKGYVVSDMGAIRNVMTQHKYTHDLVHTAAACLSAGCNLELSSTYIKTAPVYYNLTQALTAGLINRELLLERVRPLFYTRMRLGEFDPPHMNPYLQLKPEDWVQSPQHRKLAEEAVAKTLVLLVNRDNTLPFVSTLNTTAVIGPFADNARQLYGDYAPTFDPKYAVSPRKAVSADDTFGHVVYTSGCTAPLCQDYKPNDVISAVSQANVVLVFLGTGQYEREGHDRPGLELPGNQTQLIKDALEHVRDGARVVLVLFTAGPVSLPDGVWSRLSAVLQAGFPAQAAGPALVKVLTGLESPGGRLPYTWYSSLGQLPAMTNYTMEGRTYRYLRSTPLMPFGYGLSYTQFHYTALEVRSAEVTSGQDVPVSVTVSNVGARAGDEVVQLYLTWPPQLPHAPVRQLVAFSRVSLARGESRALTFSVTGQQMALWRDGGFWAVPTGKYALHAGGQQPDQNVVVHSNVLETSFVVQDFN